MKFLRDNFAEKRAVLTSLVIQDIVLIDRLELVLTPGLNVFTGETGAGKSIVLDALALALGGRSDSGLVREGAAQASVSACFTLQDGGEGAAVSLAREHGLTLEEPLILRRTIFGDGKSRAFINDQPVSVGLLRTVGELLVEFHGQFETQGLLNPAAHRGLLDAFAGLGKAAEDTRGKYAAWREAKMLFQAAQEEQKRGESEASFLRAAVAELDELAPQENENDTLTEKRKILQNSEKIAESLKACEGLLGGESGAAARLASAGKALARASDKAPGIGDVLAVVDRAAAEVEEALSTLSRLMHEGFAFGHTLETVEERLFRLRAVARKHAVLPEELSALAVKLGERLALLDEGTSSLARLAGAERETRTLYENAARALSARRKAAAQSLSRAVTKELVPLKMERALFSVLCEPLAEDAWGPEGMDRVLFVAATNPGAPSGPLHKIASGGELARFMLALKVVLAKADPVCVIVFDEVDAGIGGRQASAVGERLARLGKDVQVVVITHSPQVAARGNGHWRVEKTVRKNKALSRVVPLDKDERVEEIARMLAGETTTAAARQAALSLLDDAKKGGRETA